MKNVKINKIYNSKIFWMIISLLASVIIWGFVTSQQAVMIELDFNDVKVEFKGENQILDESNLKITNVDTESVNVVLKGTRSEIASLSSSDISAVVNVSNIYQANDYSREYEIKYPEGIDGSNIQVIKRTPETINFTVIKNTSKTVEIKGSFEGQVADGFTVSDELVFSPAKIVISGPDEIIQNIDYAWVSVGGGETIDYSKTWSASVTLKDVDGNDIDPTGLEFAQRVDVTVPVLTTKEVPLTVKLNPGGGLSEDNCTVSVNPHKVKIEADTAVIDDIESIPVAEYNLGELSESFSETVTLTAPEGITILSDVTSAEVKVSIPATYERTYSISDVDIQNVASGFSAELADDSGEIQVTLRSTSKSTLDKISAGDIKLIVDMTYNNTTKGNVDKEASVVVEGYDNVGVIGKVIVKINISKVS